MQARSAEIEKLLEELGLTDTESAIYLAGLEVGLVTVQELTQRVSIKRPTIYHALTTLSEKGLVREEQKGSKSAFRMLSPAQLYGWIEKQKQELSEKERIVQDLISKISVSGSTSAAPVTEYNDTKNVEAIFDLALYARSKRCLIVAPKELLASLDKDGLKVRDAETRGIEVRVLLKKTKAALLIYDQNLVIIENPSKAMMLTSSPLTELLSALL